MSAKSDIANIIVSHYASERAAINATQNAFAALRKTISDRITEIRRDYNNLQADEKVRADELIAHLMREELAADTISQCIARL